jgi:hypothetical protein
VPDANEAFQLIGAHHARWQMKNPQQINSKPSRQMWIVLWSSTRRMLRVIQK